LEDSIRWVGCIFQIEKDILSTFIGEFRLIGLLADLTFGLVVGEEEGIVVLALLHLVVDPILEAGVVDVFNASRALAQANKRIIAVVGGIEANTALIL
jgi:hypothetical protein